MFSKILGIVGYDGDVEAHAAELTDVLEKTIQLKVAEVTQDFMKQYFEAIIPTLTQQQQDQLEVFLKAQPGSTATTSE